ncbi:GNAT family N-acetyltransferase [Sphaerotilaceae bacterium SBD11-9]
MNQPVASLSWPSLVWREGRLQELTPLELARIYRARQLVFSIEQNCVYLDADEADERSHHLAAWSSAHELPLAYARLVEPGVKYVEPSMGRVITTEAARGTGLGRELVKRVLVLSSALYPGQGLRISAQSRLRRFYGEVGFEAVGEDYMEDGIPHIEMLRPG